MGIQTHDQNKRQRKSGHVEDWVRGPGDSYSSWTRGWSYQVERVEVVTNTSGRSVFEQALLEINNRYLNKHRQGYRAENEPPALKGPMLANKGFDLNKPNFHTWVAR